MSDLLRSLPSIREQAPPSRPGPNVLTTTRARSTSTSSDPDASSSDSSTSTADSINTLRPSTPPSTSLQPPIPWPRFFTKELHLPFTPPSSPHPTAIYHAYLTPPASPTKGPLFITHHGAGSSAMSFGPFAQALRSLAPEAGILSLSAREHGSEILPAAPPLSDPDFSIPTLTTDALRTILLVQSHEAWPSLPPCVLVGHSLGGAVFTSLAADGALGPALVGLQVLDVVEGSALEALAWMRTYLASRPSRFGSVGEAVDWHLRSRVVRRGESAGVTVPSLLVRLPERGAGEGRGEGRGQGEDGWGWRTDLVRTQGFWEGWFAGMSSRFLAGRAAKALVLAGTDRLDRELMVGQMQGRFQLTVLPEAGHFLHEDVPEKMAGLSLEFFRRNDRSALVLPPKVGELLKMGKKV
ncbi:Alpha/Beta hydrolase protein [Elsinoe ampelina]|uniref:Protein phosphatase methylesterase 1 n=1 Tax=Elsinoe ampelina TaxID=302913 RepID=A0A6A6G9U4_9PEZI|nr:Alpha/Beta hydrolase protein [Elsinoe ampelina]